MRSVLGSIATASSGEGFSIEQRIITDEYCNEDHDAISVLRPRVVSILYDNLSSFPREVCRILALIIVSARLQHRPRTARLAICMFEVTEGGVDGN